MWFKIVFGLIHFQFSLFLRLLLDCGNKKQGKEIKYKKRIENF